MSECLPCKAKRQKPVFHVVLDGQILSSHDSPMKARAEALKIPRARIRIGGIADTSNLVQ